MATRRVAEIGENGYARIADDRYFTEHWCTRAALKFLTPRGIILEPACGRGDMVIPLRDAGFTVIAADISGFMLGCDDAEFADFFETKTLPPGVETIFTNPPFTFAEEFIRHALELTRPVRGVVCMLLRQDYDTVSTQRDDLFDGFSEPYHFKLTLTRRPKWVDPEPGVKQESPRRNYAFYVWDHQYEGEPLAKYGQ